MENGEEKWGNDFYLFLSLVGVILRRKILTVVEHKLIRPNMVFDHFCPKVVYKWFVH